MRGTKRKIEHIPVKQEIKASIHNRFDIEVIDASSGKIKQRAYAENVICSALWTRLFTPSTYFSYIHYGTGSGTPSSSDTSLFTFLGYAAPTEDSYACDADAGYVSLTRKIQLSETTAVGSTLTEVGIGYSKTAATLVTHAMLKDMNGNEISIAKTSTDIINIYATVFAHWDTDQYDSGNVNVVFPMAINLSDYSGSLFRWLLGRGGSWSIIPLFMSGAVRPHLADDAGAAPADGYQGSSSNVYSAANKTVTITATRLAVGVANLAYGIGSVGLCGYVNRSAVSEWLPYVYLKVGGTWFTGSSIEAEAIATGDGSTKDFATDFDRVLSGAVIKVNGVAVSSGVSVDEGNPMNYTDMGRYFELLSANPNISGVSSRFPTPVQQYGYGFHNIYVPSGNYAIYYNPYYAKGIKSFSAAYCQVLVSDDLSTWVDITSQASNISATYRTYKYWKLVSTTSSSYNYPYLTAMTADTITSINNIHFDTAPADGDVITADYTTKTIAKNSNYVFDLTVVMTLAEKTV